VLPIARAGDARTCRAPEGTSPLSYRRATREGLMHPTDITALTACFSRALRQKKRLVLTAFAPSPYSRHPDLFFSGQVVRDGRSCHLATGHRDPHEGGVTLGATFFDAINSVSPPQLRPFPAPSSPNFFQPLRVFLRL